eukprot:9481455-Pyramimonas_sp.AAC.1
MPGGQKNDVGGAGSSLGSLSSQTKQLDVPARLLAREAHPGRKWVNLVARTLRGGKKRTSPLHAVPKYGWPTEILSHLD